MVDKSVLVQSLGTGLIFAGASSVTSGSMLGDWVRPALVSGASDLVSGEVAQVLVPAVAPTVSPQSMYVKPMVSGAVYVGADYLAKYDGRSVLAKFLYQTVASAASAYFVRPLVM